MKLAFSLILSLGYLVSSPVNVTAAQPPKAHELTHEYSFEQYIIDFNKEAIYYSQDVTLYPSKKHNFESNLRRILEHNSNVQYDLKTGKRKEDDESRNGHTYHMGVNQFMDLSQDEITSLYFGYDKKSTLHKGFIQAKDDDEDKIILKNVNDDETDHKMELPFNITDIDTLPLSINYASNKTITTPVKNQGACGSCWAFSSIAALESHLAIQTNRPANILSTQELVSCVSNPSHCGGTGGCEGATAEIAYNYVANNGIVKEESFPYKASDGPTCPLNLNDRLFESNDLVTSTKQLRTGRRRTHTNKNELIGKIKGYANVPSNDYKALMNAVAKHGPVVIATAASGWSFYEGGVYAPASPNKAIDWDLNHGVVVEGYGTDEVTNEDYWLVRNSWSDKWGEDGYIRLRRVDPESMVDDDDMEGLDCGYDETPLDGIACTLNPDGSEIIQKKVPVCGTNGLLFDPVIPVGGYEP